VIPHDVRERPGWRAGTRLEIEEQGDAVVLRRARRVPRTTVADLAGCVGYDGPAKSVEEMDAATAQGAREQSGARERSGR